MLAETQAFEQGQDYNSLVIYHSPLVQRIAYHLLSLLPPSVKQDHLAQAGYFGL